jgi:hypothetical protein
MDCREFRDQHAAYVDDVLCGEDVRLMRRHLEQCAECAKHDTKVRRGLMLARNLPPVHCSADFMERLNARLREVEPLQAASDANARRIGVAAIPFALLAASILGVAGLASFFTASEPQGPIRLAPVVASMPEPPPSLVASPMVIEALATGIPVFPAMLMVGDPATHMADVELREASLRGR